MCFTEEACYRVSLVSKVSEVFLDHEASLDPEVTRECRERQDLSVNRDH